MVLIPYNNEPAPLSSSDGDLHIDKHALGLESLPPGTRDSGFGASTASDMEALGYPADVSPCNSEDITSFRTVTSARRVPATEPTPTSGVSSFLQPSTLSPNTGDCSDPKRKIPLVPLPKPTEPPLVPPKPCSAPVVPPKPSVAAVCSPKPNESPELPPKPILPAVPQKPAVPKKPDILDFSKQSAELPASGCSPMKVEIAKLSREVGKRFLKTSEQRSAVVLENPAPPALSFGHKADDVIINMECPKVETKFPNSFVASKKKSSPSSAFHQVAALTKSRHSPQASITSNTSSDTSCSGLSSSFSSAFRQEESVLQEVNDFTVKGGQQDEEEDEGDPAVPAPMPQLPYIRANHRQRLYGRSSGSSSSSSAGSGPSLRSANIPISTPLLLHTPLPDTGGTRHFPLFHHTPGSVSHPKPSQLSLRQHNSLQQRQQEPSPLGLPSPSSSVSSGASSSKDQVATPLLQHHHNHQQQQQHQQEEGQDCEESVQQEIPDYNAVGASTCEHCVLGKCQTVYLHMPGRFHNNLF
ncbi:hypothetical protein ElyMa_006285000 [Elysia marginata]|uniref:Uncharacterized protein n=1 Tax=Elysia marginata TaxID=1093978 RepID=A0AAV4HE97_9GAST|nr:hypothetical protein ElyMa_006285000 [Elysia marginata]